MSELSLQKISAFLTLNRRRFISVEIHVEVEMIEKLIDVTRSERESLVETKMREKIALFFIWVIVKLSEERFCVFNS